MDVRIHPTMSGFRSIGVSHLRRAKPTRRYRSAFFCRYVMVALIAGFSLPIFAAPPAAAPSSPMGSLKCMPSSARPVGWRGDGTGRYPGATPPVAWERKVDGDGYAAKGFVWMAPLPSRGVATPIIVGGKLFVTSEVNDLICLDKQTGRILWIRSNPEFEGLSEEDRKSEPAYAEKLAPLAVELAKANADAVEELNALLPSAQTSAPAKKTAALTRKHDFEKQINDQQVAIDKKLYARYWGQDVFGFSGPTPTSDGQRVCAFFTTGVSVCYDLDGNRKWIMRGGGGGSEHGNFASPLLCDNRLVVWANEMRGYDVVSGKLLWSNPAKASNTYGSFLRLTSGGENVAFFQCGFFDRVRDGLPVWKQGIFGDSVCTPIIEGNTIFVRVGYPRYNDKNQGLKAFHIPESTEAGEFKAAFDFKEEWADDEIPADKKKSPFDRSFVASPLYVDGLIYQVTQGGGLLVNDAADGSLIYRKVLPLEPRTEYWNWAGCSASPALAGKLIYIMDNQGNTLIMKPGRAYQPVAQNRIVELRDNKEQAQMVSSPIFEGARMYYRSPGYLYCIGDK